MKSIFIKGQSNLAIGGIAANWGSDPKSPFLAGSPGPLSNTLSLGTSIVSLPNGILFSPMALSGCVREKGAIGEEYGRRLAQRCTERIPKYCGIPKLK